MRQKIFSERGFTLIELLIVLAFGAIMIMIPVKMLNQGDQRTMLRKHVREVVAELYRIRYNAAAMNRPYRFTMTEIAGDANHYRIENEFQDDAGVWVHDRKVPAITVSRNHLASIDLEENGTTTPAIPLALAFNPQGLQMDDAGATIVNRRNLIFTNDKVVAGDEITISISPFGGIRVSDNFNN